MRLARTVAPVSPYPASALSSATPLTGRKVASPRTLVSLPFGGVADDADGADGCAQPQSGLAIRRVCAGFVELCRRAGLLADASVAIDGSKFKAVNNRDNNFTRAKIQRRLSQIEESIACYLHQMDSADRQEPSPAIDSKVELLSEKIAKLNLHILGSECYEIPD